MEYEFPLGTKCWRIAEFIFFVISSYPFQRTSVSCVRGILPAEGKWRHTLPFRWSLTACSTSVTSLLIRCDYCLWRKRKFVCCVGRGCPLALRQTVVTCRIPFGFKTLFHSCQNFRTQSYWNNLKCSLFCSVSTCKAGENYNLITAE
jgi:hypothetical protein